MEFLEKDCTNKELCSRCKGRCCKQTGCFYMPNDFRKIEFNFLKKKIKKGYISIAQASQENGASIHYLKVRNIDSDICCDSSGGRCMLLTYKGCKLSFKKRPSGGKALIPSKNGCKSFYSKQEIIEQWKPYQKVLKQLWDYFANNSN